MKAGPPTGETVASRMCCEADADLSNLGDADRVDLDRLGGAQVQHTPVARSKRDPWTQHWMVPLDTSPSDSGTFSWVRSS